MHRAKENGVCLLVAGIIVLLSSCMLTKPVVVTYLIPEKFEGVVVIIFNQQDGVPENSDNGALIYKIPENGILRTQGPPLIGSHQNSFYYINANGVKSEIPYYTAIDVRDNKSDLSKIVCYSIERGIAQDSITKLNKSFSVFLVTSISHLDSIAKCRDMFIDEYLGNK